MDHSDSNIITENTANNNDEEGIFLDQSDSNTISSNTVLNNWIGIALYDSYFNTVVNNICLNNTEQDILQEFYPREDDSDDPNDPDDPEVPEVHVLLLIGSVVYIGLIVVTLLGGMWIVHKRVSKEGN